MLLILPAVLLAITAVGMRFAKKGELFDSLTPAYTGAVKGFFAVLILFSHMLGYIEPVSAGDRAFAMFMRVFSQFTVVMFFFYSGYGVMCSAIRKEGYRRSFFKKRILKTLLHFALAVVLYVPVFLFIGKSYSPARVALAFIGWTSIGNSNWFIFAILALYVMTLIALYCIPKRPLGQTLCVIALCAVYIVLMRIYKESFWYNTVLCYPLGMLAAIYREPLRKRCMAKGGYALCVCLSVAAAVLPAGLYLLLPRLDFQLLYLFINCAFTALLMFIGMKISIGNRVLDWLGRASFGIYILQRLGMNLLRHYGVERYPLIFCSVSIAAALVLAWGFEWLTGALDRRLFAK